MKIVFTSFHETYSNENKKNYTPNSYVSVFLISVIWFFCLQFRTEEYDSFVSICLPILVF